MKHTFETERLVLRPFDRNDSDRIEELAGDYEIAKTTLAIPHPYPPGSAKDFIKAVQESDAKGDSLTVAICLKGSPELIGTMGLVIKDKHKRAELVYWVGKPYWGQGYATEAAQQILKVAFEELGLNRVYAAAMTHNPGSWKVMQKIGMQLEGTFREHVIKAGEPIDLTFYSILRSEYEQR